MPYSRGPDVTCDTVVLISAACRSPSTLFELSPPSRWTLGVPSSSSRPRRPIRRWIRRLLQRARSSPPSLMRCLRWGYPAWALLNQRGKLPYFVLPSSLDGKTNYQPVARRTLMYAAVVTSFDTPPSYQEFPSPTP